MGKMKVKITQLPKSMFVDCPVCEGNGKSKNPVPWENNDKCEACMGRGKVYGGNRKERRKKK